MSERVFKARIIAIILIMIITLRLYYLMIICNDKFKNSVELQNTINININNSRNNFVDRYSRRITGVEKRGYIIIFSSNDEKIDKNNCDILECYTDESSASIYNRLKNQGKTFVRTNIDINKYQFKKNKYISPFYTEVRYLSDYPAASLIGYLSGDTGVYGLEKVFNDVLVNNSSDAYVSIDALNNMIGNINHNSKNNTKDVQLTIDLQLQRVVEKCLKLSGYRCSAVLLNVNNFDVLAMASYPNFEQDNIIKFLDQDRLLQNNSMSAYDMGSIFKIVVTAAALEYNCIDLNKIYECKGSINVSGKTFKCHNIFGHGKQNLSEAFKNSCNCAFIEIGQAVGYNKILQLAKKFGLGNKRLFPLELEQQQGVLPDENNYYLADLANLSIGQGKLSGTVLDGASISAVIANSGYNCNINCVQGIINEKGKLIQNVRNDKREKIISDLTAERIKNMMILTNESGTGTTAALDNYVSGGKTGSAQTGWYVDGENYQHGWYTGFFPAVSPQYALCVFVENGKSGSETAAPIFKMIGDSIMSLETGR